MPLSHPLRPPVAGRYRDFTVPSHSILTRLPSSKNEVQGLGNNPIFVDYSCICIVLLFTVNSYAVSYVFR